MMGAVEELRMLAQSQMDMRSLAFVLQLGDQHKVAFFGGYQRDPAEALGAFRLLERNAQWRKSMVCK